VLMSYLNKHSLSFLFLLFPDQTLIVFLLT
jgi:hypothetical protein